jgi:hypothetical protein
MSSLFVKYVTSGDRDYNDLAVGLDFTSASAAGG